MCHRWEVYWTEWNKKIAAKETCVEIHVQENKKLKD